jgi:chromate transporter
MAAAAFVAIFAFDVPFPAIVLAPALLGWLGGRSHQAVRRAAATARRQAGFGPALIDDDTPRRPMRASAWGRLVRLARSASAVGCPWRC